PAVRVRLRRAAPLPAPSHNWGSAPDPAPQTPEGLEGGASPQTLGSRGGAPGSGKGRGGESIAMRRPSGHPVGHR
ncbi:hypothetical protein FGK60_46870, partial [Streptomyces sp. DASNCL29]